ncbi:MAG TPA: lipid A biosynthesis lauroyl acyltransferase [Candidatus Sulfotelmatobacter sp.]|jgi:KDO2-lipid IV(A) lauroyltransferase|nr:lipid A biosynthesis lauroyl acyltransferase [Candidatus Sulfotelmatobacter sp.]
MSAKELKNTIEAVIVWIVFHLFRLLPVDAASAVGGWIGRSVGYRLPVTRRARRNLKRAFPDWPTAKVENTLRSMWDNLGRVAGEYPHLEKFSYGPGQRVEVEGIEHLLGLRDDGRPGIFFSAHFGNWELAGLSAARNDLPITLIYRAANNARVNWVFERGRSVAGIDVIPKGASGARQALAKLKQGGHLGMLVDQKMNDGIAVPFFGRDAMTAPALAAFALKFDCPAVPAHVIRENGAHFRIVFQPALRFTKTGDQSADLLSAMTQVNGLIEEWVRAHPDQWMWLHKRWPD